MLWPDSIIQALRDHEIWHIAYVPDAINWNVLAKLEQDSAFTVVAATREEEAVGIATGVYAGGGRCAVFMQSSGFGNTVNGLAQLGISSRVGLPFVVGMRGGLGEFNEVQVPAAQAIPGILDALNIPHYAPLTEDQVLSTVSGAFQLAFSSRLPVGILLYASLVGAKRATS